MVFVDQKLISFLEADSLPEEVEMRKALCKRLPDYEIPEFVHALDKFPRNNNDKIDYKALSKLAENRLLN